jgi:hypothetical protein
MGRRERRRRWPPAPRRGDTVIDGRVRARLLGLTLLELDAHVVVATASGAPAVAQRPVEGRRAVARTDGHAPPELARAVRLLAEGTTALDAARRIH